MRLKRRFAFLALAATYFSMLTAPAFAHTEGEAVLGLKTGFLHPMTGADHLVAMVAVGLWGAQLGNPAIWVLPITFPLVMAVGSVFGIAGGVLPFPEWIIGLSALALGSLVALRIRPPFWAAAFLVAVF